MSFEERLVSYEKKNRVAHIKLNRPHVLNAMNVATMSAIAEAVTRFQDDPDAWAAILSGEGKGFCVGGDLKEALTLLEGPPRSFYDLPRQGLAAIDLVARSKKPIIAAVHGFCMAGGLLLANACHLIIAAESTTFAMPEVAIGMPTLGYFDLWKTIGTRSLLELVLTGQSFTAQKALEMGLINRMVPEERVFQEAIALAEIITKNSPLSVSAHLEAIRFSVKYDSEVLNDAASYIWDRVIFSKDLKEGLSAFKEKRPPQWLNR